MSCFYEGDQHENEREPALIVTTVPNTTGTMFLQAVVDIQFSTIPSDPLPQIRPDMIDRPQTGFSKERYQIFQKELAVDDISKGRRKEIIDFTGQNVEEFCQINRLLIVEREKYRMGANDSLAQLTLKTF